MRKHKFVIGVCIALAGSLIAASAAMAVNSQKLTVLATPTKQFKKTKGAGALDVDIATTIPLGTPVAQTASHTDVDFDKDYKFTPGKLPQCNPISLANTTTAAAQAACPGSQVGQGTAALCSPAVGCGAGPGTVPVTVTAFNGTTAGGNPTFLLHAKPGGVAAQNPPLVLVGTLIRSPVGGAYGMRLSVEVQDTASTQLHLVDFHTIVNKVQTVKRNKKKNKPAQFYISANCSDKSWEFSETTQYRAGGGTSTSTTSVPCSQKKEKKKKK
jgi:hypothetical protein